MKIGLVVAGGVDRTGRGRVVPELLDLLGELAQHHAVHVVALRQEPRPGSWRVAGAEVRNVGARPRRLRALLHLAREHRRAPFDVLVGYGLVPQGVVTAVAGALLDVPWVVAAPGGEFASLPHLGFGGWRNARGRMWVRLATRGAAACVVPSGLSLGLARARGISATVIPLPIARGPWPAGEARPDAPPRIAWVGSLNRVKDPALLVDTLRGLRDAGVDFAADVVGEDFLAGEVGRRVAEAGLEERVTLHGRVDQPEVRAILARASLLLLTSRFEGGPRVVLEAATLAVPTVGAPVGYVAAWAPDAAVAVADPCPSTLGGAVAALLADPARSRRIGRAARGRVAEHDAAVVAARWTALLERASRASGRARG